MTELIKHKIKSTDVVLLTAILDVLTPAQVLMLVDQMRRVMCQGYGRLTITIHAGKPSEIQATESYRFEDD